MKDEHSQKILESLHLIVLYQTFGLLLLLNQYTLLVHFFMIFYKNLSTFVKPLVLHLTPTWDIL